MIQIAEGITIQGGIFGFVLLAWCVAVVAVFLLSATDGRRGIRIFFSRRLW